MSLLLTLAITPYYRPNSGDTLLPHVRFPFISRLRELQLGVEPFAQPLTDGMDWWRRDTGHCVLHHDAYGEPLEFVMAGHLIPLLVNAVGTANESFDLAAIQYLTTVPETTPVALYWH